VLRMLRPIVVLSPQWFLLAHQRATRSPARLPGPGRHKPIGSAGMRKPARRAVCREALH